MFIFRFTCHHCKKVFKSREVHRRRYCLKCAKLKGAIKTRKWYHKTKKDPHQVERRRKYGKSYKNSEWYKLKRRAIRNKRTLTIRTEAITEYGGKCTCCGEKEVRFLTLDHSNKDGSVHRRQIAKERGINRLPGGSLFYFELKKLGYPKTLGLKVMCYNCHMSKDHYGFCTHQQYGEPAELEDKQIAELEKKRKAKVKA